MITVNKEIFTHSDFCKEFENGITEMLEELIDAEFAKEDADFDFIDECADVINAIRCGDFSAVMPVISRKDFIEKVSGTSKGIIKKVTAVCAAVAIAIGINAYVRNAENNTIIGEIANYLAGLFGEEPSTLPPETTTEISTTEPSTTEPAVVTELAVEFGENFRTEYTVGESFDKTGLEVYAVYNTRSSEKLGEDEYEITVSPDFAKTEGYETVTVKYAGFEEKIELRILVGKKTPKLTSVYAIFPEDYDFTSPDIDNISLDMMQVYAVYSDDSEKELDKGEYTVDYEYSRSWFEESVYVTVRYRECSCSFTVFEK